MLYIVGGYKCTVGCPTTEGSTFEHPSRRRLGEFSQGSFIRRTDHDVILSACGRIVGLAVRRKEQGKPPFN
jgi:hypothetical protein